ncbi:MAG TPA: AAA family ATPase [Candidatus Acidoferrum sp.]|nr:AAA family ATPase [Candidatus Acidoferrum sp.]
MYGVSYIKGRILIAITGTPGTGKSYFAKRLHSSIPEVRIIEINEVVKRHRLFSGIDVDRAKIVKMKALEKRLRKEVTNSKGPVALVGHLAADLDMHYDICIVTRRNLSKLILTLKRRKYGGDKLSEDVFSEALDYCGVNSEPLSKELYEVESEKEKLAAIKYIRGRVDGKKAAKPKLKMKRKLGELALIFKNGKIEA